MASVLHLVGANGAGRALPVIAEQVAAGDTVTVAIVGHDAVPLAPGLTVHRVPTELPWDQLLELIFTVEQTFTW